jgi:hypothetical protein
VRTLEDYEKAYRDGYASKPEDTNPHYPLSPEYIQWDYGRREAGIFAPSPPPTDKLARAFKYLVYLTIATAVISVVRFATA